MIRKNILSLFLVTLLIASCDSGISDDRAIEPNIVVELIDLRQNASSNKLKTDRAAIKEVWTVGLTVTNLQNGSVVSPPSITADNQTDTDVRFNLSLSEDSLYSFRVSFTQAGRVAGRGLVHHYLTSSTNTVTVPAYLTDASNPALIFEPSIITKPASLVLPASSEINMIYLGTTEPAEALAAKMDVSGIDETLLTIQGPSTVLETGAINLVWNWADEPASATPISVGVISYPSNTNTGFCFDVEEGNARIVHPDASISRQAVKSEACVDFGN